MSNNIKYPLNFKETRNPLERIHFYISNILTDRSVSTYPLSNLSIDLEYKSDMYKYFFEKNYNLIFTDRHFLPHKEKRNLDFNVLVEKYTAQVISFFEITEGIYAEVSIFGQESSNLFFVYKETPKNIEIINKLVEELKPYELKDENKNGNYIYTLTVDNGMMFFDPVKVEKPKFKLEENYNDDILDRCNVIIKKLKQKKGKGMLLLHGVPGTGKTAFIRYLVSKVKNKNFLFIESNMMKELGSPQFMALIKGYPNSILILEEADNLLLNKEDNYQNADVLRNILNITDGIVSDYTNIQIIATFNTKVSNIDNALKRKGRLIDIVEFEPLDKEKANNLSKKLKLDVEFNENVPITEVYNYDSVSFNEEYRTIGFSPTKK